MDAIDELVARSVDHPKLRRFHQLHRSHPEILDFLVSEVRLRIEHGFPSFSYHSLWEYARWKLEMEKGPGGTFLMNDHAAPFYARVITILHPEFNGRAEFRQSAADAAFGTRVEAVQVKRPAGCARRLEWTDGTPIADGWRPKVGHVVTRRGNRRADIHERT